MAPWQAYLGLVASIMGNGTFTAAHKLCKCSNEVWTGYYCVGFAAAAMLTIPCILWTLAVGLARHLRQPEGPRLFDRTMMLFGAAQVAILTCVVIMPTKCQEAFVLPVSAILGILAFPAAVVAHWALPLRGRA